jgi:hypothetical protein
VLHIALLTISQHWDTILHIVGESLNEEDSSVRLGAHRLIEEYTKVATVQQDTNQCMRFIVILLSF